MRRVALVTGGSRGIGAATVQAFASRGVDVAFTFHTDEVAAKQVQVACGENSADVQALRYDLLSSVPEDLVADVVSRFGRLDSVVLNAGLWQGGRLTEMSASDWWRVVEVNLRGCARLAAAVVAAVAASESGSLVMLSSAVGVTGFPGDTAYSAAKSGVIGFARSLAKEVAKTGTRVNVLAPGFVETDMTASIPERSRQHILGRTLLGRFATADEIAKAVVFLSEDATFCTGAVLSADGGWTL